MYLKTKYFMVIVAFLLSSGYLSAAVITVTNLDNDGTDSLRCAVFNARAGDTIVFQEDLQGSINLDRVLANISVNDLTIVGNLLPNGVPKIALNGSNLHGDSWGFFIDSASATNCSISNLAFVGFNNGTPGRNNVGMYVNGASNDVTISNCYFGTTNGVDSVPNSVGVFIFNHASFTIKNSVISNNNTGIYVFGSGDGDIIGNYIGINSAGSAALPNIEKGIYISGSSNITVGGEDSSKRNVISGNSSVGLLLEFSSNCNVINNYIGTDFAGLLPLGNGGDGIFINNCSGTTIDSNVISGNGADGIRAIICSDSLIGNNYIGLDTTGTVPMGNIANGIEIDANGGNCDSNVIGGNVISANVVDGISFSVNLFDVNASMNNVRIEYNFIGTDYQGNPLPGLGNGGDGLFWGGDHSGEEGGNGTITNSVIVGNVIAGNALNGINFGDNVVGNTIANNKIGVAADGVSSLPNALNGIAITSSSIGASENMFGGLDTNDGNIIAYNGNYGISAQFGVDALNSFLTNSIYGNVLTPAISLNKVENNGQKPPVILGAAYDKSALSVNVIGVAPAVGSHDPVPLLLQFFVTPASLSASNPQGKTYLGSIEVPAGELFSESFIFISPDAGNYFVTAIATALNNSGGPGDSSGFSNPAELQVSSFNNQFTQRLIQKYNIR